MKFWLDPSHKASFEHARLLTAHFSKSFYLSAKMLPQERRWATYALYGFCRYADNLIDNPRGRTHTELLDEVAYLSRELEVAHRTGESENPIVGPYIVVAQRYGIPERYAQELLKGVQMDIQKARYETFDDLYVFCYRVAGVVGLMMNHVLGYKDDRAVEFAEKLGIAMQLTNILRDVREDMRMGRIYLPQEEMRTFSVSEADIAAERMTPEMRNLMQFQVRRAHQYYHEAAHGIPMLARESQFAIYSASRIYRGILGEIEKRDYNPFLGRVFVSQKRKLGILVQEILRTRLLPAPKRPAITPRYELPEMAKD